MRWFKVKEVGSCTAEEGAETFDDLWLSGHPRPRSIGFDRGVKTMGCSKSCFPVMEWKESQLQLTTHRQMVSQKEYMLCQMMHSGPVNLKRERWMSTTPRMRCFCPVHLQPMWCAIPHLEHHCHNWFWWRCDVTHCSQS